MKHLIPELNETLPADNAELLLRTISERFPSITLASSLGAEDQVLTHMICSQNLPISIFMLDTGRLHQETYSVMSKTQDRYGIRYQVYFPQTDAVQEMTSVHGPNLFYQSIDHRKQCCGVRKIEPLGRALANQSGWITGQRREQSITRNQLDIVEWDAAHSILKFNPLATWSTEQVWAYIRTHSIPYNILHDRGFPSIGCAPCTRAIKPNEDIRSGRWWWEDPDKKECGLHIKTEG
jgi:phosphoadenosine phosphosulfate reductase